MLRKIRFRLLIVRLFKSPGSASVLMEDGQGRLLVVKANYKSYWSLPGGWIDKNESPATAALRELKEEVGIELEATRIQLERVIYRRSLMLRTNQFIFRALDPLSAELHLTLQRSEIENYDWVAPQQIIAPSDGRYYNRSVLAWAKGEPSYIEQAL